MVFAAEDAAADAEAEDRETQGGEVVDVADDNLLAAHVDGNDALASNQSLAIFGESDVLVVYAMVGDEGFVGVLEVVGSSAIQDCDLCVGVCGGGKDVGWARGDYLREGGGESWWTR